MVKVTFDYGNKEDHVLIQEMIGEPVSAPVCANEVEEHKAEFDAQTSKICDKATAELLDPVVETLEKMVEKEKSAPGEAKTITAAEALPKVAAYCQANGLDKPQAYFARIGKKNIHDLSPEQIVELLTELNIEV